MLLLPIYIFPTYSFQPLIELFKNARNLKHNNEPMDKMKVGKGILGRRTSTHKGRNKREKS